MNASAAGAHRRRERLTSVVIAAYNAERTLGATIESVLSQDYEPVETIVVDDGSTDGTAGVVRSFAGVRYLRQERAGPSAARNRGVAEARGDFVAFVDADDEVPSTKLSLQVGLLIARPEVGCVLGRQAVSVEEGGAPAWLGHDPMFGDFAGIPLMSLVARRATLLELGGFDPALRVAEDRDLLVRMREHGIRIEVVDQVVLLRRFHGGNLTFDRPESHPLLRSLKAKLDRGRDEASAESG